MNDLAFVGYINVSNLVLEHWLLMKNDVLNSIFDVLSKHNKGGQELTKETLLVADLGLDSVEVMEMLEQIEDRFDISIPLNIIPEVRTVQDLNVQLQKLIK